MSQQAFTDIIVTTYVPGDLKGLILFNKVQI